jgi:hypothetical protein
MKVTLSPFQFGRRLADRRCPSTCLQLTSHLAYTRIILGMTGADKDYCSCRHMEAISTAGILLTRIANLGLKQREVEYRWYKAMHLDESLLTFPRNMSPLRTLPSSGI